MLSIPRNTYNANSGYHPYDSPFRNDILHQERKINDFQQQRDPTQQFLAVGDRLISAESACCKVSYERKNNITNVSSFISSYMDHGVNCTAPNKCDAFFSKFQAEHKLQNLAQNSETKYNYRSVYYTRDGNCKVKLCAYCEINWCSGNLPFYSTGDNSFGHHMKEAHGIMNDGSVAPQPTVRLCEKLQTDEKELVGFCPCQDGDSACEFSAPLNFSDPHNAFKSFHRHYRDVHYKRGSRKSTPRKLTPRKLISKKSTPRKLTPRKLASRKMIPEELPQTPRNPAPIQFSNNRIVEQHIEQPLFGSLKNNLFANSSQVESLNSSDQQPFYNQLNESFGLIDKLDQQLDLFNVGLYLNEDLFDDDVPELEPEQASIVNEDVFDVDQFINFDGIEPEDQEERYDEQMNQDIGYDSCNKSGNDCISDEFAQNLAYQLNCFIHTTQ